MMPHDCLLIITEKGQQVVSEKETRKYDRKLDATYFGIFMFCSYYFRLKSVYSPYTFLKLGI